MLSSACIHLHQVRLPVPDLLQLIHLVDHCHREEKGVKVRVELGPRDAQKSQACLAISSTPGQVAKKDVFQVTHTSR